MSSEPQPRGHPEAALTQTKKESYEIKGIGYTRPTNLYHANFIKITRHYNLITATFPETFEGWLRVHAILAARGLKTRVTERRPGILRLRVREDN
jgi:hypothetical protein